MPEPFKINGYVIEPGQQQTIQMQVGRLPSGNKISINAHVYRSKHPGPTVLVQGGVHGDEINGVEIVRRTITSGLFDQLQSGNIIAIPLLNIFGFINFSRDTPDGKDVNRSFPGNRYGSLSSRVARTLTSKILPMVDFGVDFHTGGGSRYNYPQIRFTKDHGESRLLAELFGAPYLIGNTPIPKSLRKVALGLGIPILVFEGGESLRYDGFSIEHGINGLCRLLHAKGMLPEAPAQEQVVHVRKASWVRAARAGLFIWFQQSGAKVSTGEPLGVINDPYGKDAVTIYSNRDGYILGHNNAPVVSVGDALFHIGYQAEPL